MMCAIIIGLAVGIVVFLVGSFVLNEYEIYRLEKCDCDNCGCRDGS